MSTADWLQAKHNWKTMQIHDKNNRSNKQSHGWLLQEDPSYQRGVKQERQPLCGLCRELSRGLTWRPTCPPCLWYRWGCKQSNQVGRGGKMALEVDGGCGSNSSHCGRCWELLGGSLDAFNLHGARRAQLMSRIVGGRHLNYGWCCGDGVGGFGQKISAVDKEGRPRESSDIMVNLCEGFMAPRSVWERLMANYSKIQGKQALCPVWSVTFEQRWQWKEKREVQRCHSHWREIWVPDPVWSKH
jgi:hypothetical protein